jgi:hypothetical protein
VYTTGQRIFDWGHAIGGTPLAHGGKEFLKICAGAEGDSGPEMRDGGLSAVGT